jgi:glucose/arabinose dehydrogenase
MKFKLLMLVTLILGFLPPPRAAQASIQEAPKAAGLQVYLDFELVASGLSQPVDIVHAGDNSGRLFIVLLGGQIRIYDGTQILPTPFLNITSLVTSGGERGLLGMAFHPNYENNGYFYVNYTRTFNGKLETVIARYQVSSDPNIANNASETILLIVEQDFSNHNGGQLHFGPDGYLYIGLGDGGGSGDPNNRAQQPNSLLGKMLRIDVDLGSPYSIPADNPFIQNASVRDEIWAFGLRNPWRFSFDRQMGDLFIADVGQGAWEEVNFQLSSSSGGENYGWSCFEGSHVYNATRNCSEYGVLTGPAIEYPHGQNNSNGCSVTGGYIYRGEKFPQMEGVYLYGDFCNGKIWGAVRNDSNWTSHLLIDTPFHISTFGEDEAGELYLASYGEGRIYRVTASTFADVPMSYPFWEYITAIYNAGITGGCTSIPLNYCPNNNVTRSQMAIFLLRGKHGSSYTPPAPAGDVFGDVPVNAFAAAWIEQLAVEGITGGCGDGNYCPNNFVTRSQMAIFLLRAKYGSDYIPPAVGEEGTSFNDVPADAFAAAWIKQLAAEGITGGCGGGNYCPDNPVTRFQMAIFLVRTFNLPLP